MITNERGDELKKSVDNYFDTEEDCTIDARNIDELAYCYRYACRKYEDGDVEMMLADYFDKH